MFFMGGLTGKPGTRAKTIFLVQELLFLVTQSGKDIISFSFQGSVRSRLNFNY